jgi:hypothetical protein
MSCWPIVAGQIDHGSARWDPTELPATITVAEWPAPMRSSAGCRPRSVGAETHELLCRSPKNPPQTIRMTHGARTGHPGRYLPSREARRSPQLLRKKSRVDLGRINRGTVRGIAADRPRHVAEFAIERRFMEEDVFTACANRGRLFSRTAIDASPQTPPHRRRSTRGDGTRWRGGAGIGSKRARRALTPPRMERPSAGRGEQNMSDWKIQLRGTCERCGGAGRVTDPKSGRLLDCHPCDSTGEVHPFVPLAELKALLEGM